MSKKWVDVSRKWHGVRRRPPKGNFLIACLMFVVVSYLSFCLWRYTQLYGGSVFYPEGIVYNGDAALVYGEMHVIEYEHLEGCCALILTYKREAQYPIHNSTATSWLRNVTTLQVRLCQRSKTIFGIASAPKTSFTWPSRQHDVRCHLTQALLSHVYPSATWC